MGLLELLMACGSVGTTDSAAEDSKPAEPAPHEIMFADENNYSMSASIDIPSVDVAELGNVEVDWAAVTKDIQCHDVDPAADIDSVSLMVFPNLSHEDIEQGLADGTLEQTELGGYVSGDPGDGTSYNLTDLTFFGTDVDIELLFAENSGSWMMLISTGTTVGVGARDMLFLNPLSAETNTRASFEDGCGRLTIDPDLDTLTPVPIAAESPWTVDWSELTQDGQDHEMEFGDIDLAMLAWYPGYSTQALEEDFFDLELNAALTWTVELTGYKTLDLGTLVDADAAAFPGFAAGEGDGLWLFALRCTLCPNPAPLFLTVLEPG